MVINPWIRQGDVILTMVNNDSVDTNERLETKTIALGEVTGHSHSFSNNKGQVLLFGDNINGPQTLIIESETAPLTHQEHKTLEIPKGVYKITKERSFDYFTKAVRKTVD